MSDSKLVDLNQNFLTLLAQFNDLTDSFFYFYKPERVKLFENGQRPLNSYRASFYGALKALFNCRAYEVSPLGSNVDNGRNRKPTYRLMPRRTIHKKIWEVGLNKINDTVGRLLDVDKLGTMDGDLPNIEEQFIINLDEMENTITILCTVYESVNNCYPTMIPQYPKIRSVEHFFAQYALHRYQELCEKYDSNLFGQLLDFLVSRIQRCILIKDELSLLVDDKAIEHKLLPIYSKYKAGNLPFIYKKTLVLELKLGDGVGLSQQFTKKYLEVINYYQDFSDTKYIKRLRRLLFVTKKVLSNECRQLSDYLCQEILKATLLNEVNLKPLLKTNINHANISSLWLIIYGCLRNGTVDMCRGGFSVAFDDVSDNKFWSIIKQLLETCINRPYEQEIKLLIWDSLRKRFHGDLHLVEFLASTLDSYVKKFMEHVKSLASLNTKWMESKFYEKSINDMKSILKVIDAMNLLSTFIPYYYEKYWFRRLILYANEYKKCVDENVVLIEQEISDMAGSSIVLALTMMDVINGIKKNGITLEMNNIDTVSVAVPRSAVPEVFLEYDVNVKTLPKSLQSIWDEINVTRNFLHSASVVQPQFALHHLEIETPFMLSNNAKLIVDVTMVQACILEQFNEDEEIKIDDLASLYGIDKAELTVAMESFVGVGMVKKVGIAYSLNYDYNPNSGVNVSGKKRIPYTISRPTQKEHSRDTSWIIELLRAAIIRTLKYEQKFMTFDELRDQVSTQLGGVSVAEFKLAVDKCSDYYTKEKDMYKFVW
ncbi:HBR404Wp [Eremothecium sinecaudum]|uniref:HBR404Wp n=1 Tax=Eremothecium sinecaudum TaxID=45286 RepID=A0A120K1E7_9SACH|nr:HBR404Wp [Eremothecium sinecaudum]AMD19305.1 HBR404Wp [Eremothecium sinecaudum]